MKAKRTSTRYKLPDLNAETLESIRTELMFAQARIARETLAYLFFPKLPNAALNFVETRASHGAQLHAGLLRLVAFLNKPERFEFHPEHAWLRKNAERLKTAFARICAVAVAGDDAAFFQHVALCLDFINRPREKGQPQEKEPFKAAVLVAYKAAKHARFEKDRDAGCLREDVPGHECFSLTHPSWHDVDDELRAGVSKLCPGDDFLLAFSKKDLELRRRQIEAALKKMDLPFHQKTQVQ